MRSLLTHGGYRGLTVALLVCTLAMRLLIPSGLMLAPGTGDSLPMITICSGQGIMTMAMPAGMDAAAVAAQAGQKDSGQHPKPADHPCAFAAAGAAVDLAGMLHPAEPFVADAVARPLFHAFTRPGLGLAAPPPPKTGPPFLA